MYFNNIDRKTISISIPTATLQKMDLILQESYPGRSRSSLYLDLIQDFIERWEHAGSDEQEEGKEKESG